MILRYLLFVVVLAFGICAGVFAGDFEDGFAAYERGDYATAFAKFKGPAEQGYAFAQYNLGLMYEKGQGVAQDYEQAVFWYDKAAVQGATFAQTNLGVMYQKGQGVAKDYKQAVFWWEKAAAQEHAWAQYNLGLMYANGQGVPKDYVQAHVWWNLAASQGFDEAKKYRDLLEQRMTPQQIAEAQRIAREREPRPADAQAMPSER